MNIVDSAVFQMEGEEDTVHLLTSLPSPMFEGAKISMSIQCPEGTGVEWAQEHFGVNPRILDDPDYFGVCPWDTSHVLHEGG